MLVFWKEKLVLLAVPKTGTTSLEQALAPRSDMVIRNPPELKHANYARYQRWIEPFLEKAGGPPLETLAVVRHPIDWLGSWYRYRHRDALVGRPNSTRDMSFDTFVNDYCRGKQPPHAHVGSQAKFVSNSDGARGVDHLFRYEEPDRLSAFVESRLGYRPDAERANVSPTVDLVLSPGVEAKLRRKRPEEFDLWEQAGA